MNSQFPWFACLLDGELLIGILWAEEPEAFTGPVISSLPLVVCNNSTTQQCPERATNLLFSVRSILSERGKVESVVEETDSTLAVVIYT